MLFLFCVPTPFDKHKIPDLEAVRSAATSAAATLQKGQLIVFAIDDVSGHYRRSCAAYSGKGRFKGG